MECIQKIETAFKIQRIKNLTIEEKIKIFKAMAIFKIKHFASETV